MVKKKRSKKIRSIKIDPILFKFPKPKSEIKKRELIYFRKPCSRCDKMFTPTSKTGKICPNCFIRK
jgi:formylmethanofuran dehydrogenase subunit E